MQRQTIENDAQRKAFELWWNNGNRGVSYQKIGTALGFTKISIYNWSKRFNWQDRAMERAIAINARVDRVAINDATADRLTALKMTRKALEILDKKIDEKNIKVDIQDLDKLIRLQEFLRGEPDSRSEELTVDKVDQEIRRLEAQLATQAGADTGTTAADANE